MRVAFDFDGTVADTMPRLEELAVDLLRSHLPERLARTRYRATAGDPFRTQLDTILPTVDSWILDDVADHYEKLKPSTIADTGLRPHIGRAIRRLRRTDVYVAVVSSSTPTLVADWFRREGPAVQWLGGFPPAKRHQLESVRATVFVGDTDSDRVLAADLGIRFVGVPSPYLSGDTVPLDEIADRILVP